MKPLDHPLLEVRGLHKRFGDRIVLDSVDLQVPRGSVVSLLGRSGTGKSVFLKCLAGLLKPDGGEVYFRGEPAAGRSHAATEFRRLSRYLFQGNALFDSLTSLENVALPLQQTTDLSPAEIGRRAHESMARLGLADFARHYPAQLSGGMQKRLALARALVTEPAVVLFDEPTAGLDPLSRNSVFEMIAQFRRTAGFTAIVVTHDVAEALVVSDRVALLEAGRVRFIGSSEEFGASADPAVTALRVSQSALKARLAEISQSTSASEVSAS